MKPDIVRSLTTTFEGHAQQAEIGGEYWLARDRNSGRAPSTRSNLI